MSRPILQRSSQAPLYYTIFEQLRGEILSGHIGVGKTMPSEASLMQRFGVSRYTIREALRQLKEADLVETHQGSATVVLGGGRPHQYVYRLNDVRDMHDRDVETVYDNETEWVRLDAELGGLVAAAADERWLRVTGVRMRPGQGLPICAFTLFIARRFAEVVDSLTTETGPVYALIESKYGEPIDDVAQWIRAFKAGPRTDQRLGLEENEVGIEIRRVFRTISGDPCMISVNHYLADNFLISMNLSRASRDA